MNPPVVTVPPKRRWSWRKRFAVALALFVLLVTGVILFLWFKAGSDLDAAIAEADRLDPGWRFEELEAKRAKIADDDNAALQILAAEKQLPPSWPIWESGPFQDRFALSRNFAEVPTNALLTSAQAQAMSEARATAGKALAAARKVKDMPHGRYPVVRGADGLPQPSFASTRIADLLYYDLLLRANDQDMDGALESCRGFLNVARAYGDEPDYFTQLRRMEMRGSVCRNVERVLAQGEASEVGLAATQKLLEDEEPQTVFLHGARGLRAWMDGVLEGVRDGKVQPPQIPSALTGAFVLNVRPTALRMTTRLVEVAKRPVEEQQQALDEGGRPQEGEGTYLARLHIVPKIQHAEHHLALEQIRSQAELRCAIVALAAERYRLKHGEWPATAAALVPGYLSAVPTDPFDRQPVRYRRLPDGLVIYCLGPDRTDNQGTLDRGVHAPAGTDVGVQLWDIGQRRQPAPAMLKAAGD